MMRIAVAYIALLLLLACASAPAPRATPIEDIPGDALNTFTLIFFLGNDPAHRIRAVILDIEGDKSTITPEADFLEYEILQSLTLNQALKETHVFFRSQGFMDFVKSSIVLPDSRHIGYEFRPLFGAPEDRNRDRIKIVYGPQKGNSIPFSVRLK